MPLVSVVMSSYNHGLFIAESVESVLGQDFEDFELIIVDDNSADASRDIIQKYEAQDARIRVILHEANRGAAKTTNDGIEAAKGEFIAFIASDDVWAKQKLTKQLSILAEDDDLVVWAEGSIVDESGRFTGKSFTDLEGSISKKKGGRVFEELLVGNYIFGSTLIYKKANLGAIRLDESLKWFNDYKFVLELSAKYNFFYIGEPLAQYRIHPNSTLGPVAIKKNPERPRTALREEIWVREEALRQHYNNISEETKARVFEEISLNLCTLGKRKSAMRYLLRAARCNRRSKYLHYMRLFLLCLLFRVVFLYKYRS